MTDFCGVTVSCGNFFYKNRYLPSYTVLKTWTTNTTAGLNTYDFDINFLAPKGSLALITTTTPLYIEDNGNATYSDYFVAGTALRPMNKTFNGRIYLNCILQQSFYMISINIRNEYASAGSYYIKTKFSNINKDSFALLQNITSGIIFS